MKRIILVDGNSLMYRAYYATAFTGNLMQNSKGLYTNAIYSFIKMFEHLACQEYDNILVAFDAGKQTFRHEILDSYKGGRSPMPEEMRVQIPHIKEYLHLMNIKEYQLPLYEADDIIGSMARLAINEGYHVDIYSSDKDLLQLVNPNTTVHLTKKGMTDLEDFTPEHVIEKYGLTYEQMVDLKALMGDPSDNLKGLPGVGEKTAIKLLQEYGSLNNLIENKDSVKGKLGEKVREFYNDAVTCQKMCTINRESPIEITLNDTIKMEPNFEKLNEFYRFLEFHSMLKKVNVAPKVDANNYQVVEDIMELKKILLPNSYMIFETFDYNYHKSDLLAIGIHNHLGTFIIEPNLLDYSIDLRLFLSDENNKNIFDLKRAYVWLNEHGYHFGGVGYDMMLASYICAPSLKNIDFAIVCNHFEYHDINYDEDIYGKGAKHHVPEKDLLYGHIAKKCVALAKLKPVILEELEKNNQLNLLNDIEIPLATVLGKMEVNGMKIDLNELNRQKALYEEEIKKLEAEIYALAGMEFNIQSPKQLGEILFEKMGLPIVKKNKNGYSTDIEVLKYLEDKHPIIPLIMRYRTVTKLHQTYLEGMASQIYPDGKIHTIFEQALTTTGRLSSIEPNVQNIPTRTTEGKMIRKFFVPEEGNWLFSSDYSQVELRVLAHMANVKLLSEAFNEGLDVHSETAKKIFKVDEVTSLLRRRAKAVNFGIVYGISAYGLAEGTDLTNKEAKEFIDAYFDLYPEIKHFMDQTVEFAKEHGYVVTLSNRRRYIPELKSPVYMQREFGKRTAMNAPIQGSAADIIKIAMINIDKEMVRNNLKSKMVFQVHDELVFEVLDEEKEILERIVTEEMEFAFKLNVPLEVDFGFGKNWMEVK